MPLDLALPRRAPLTDAIAPHWRRPLLHLALAKAGLDAGLGSLTLLMGRVNALALLLVLALLLRLHLCQKQALLLLLTQELELCERGVPCE